MVIEENKMNNYFTKVFLWMFIGLFVSGGIAYFTANNYGMLRFVSNFYLIIIILELICVVAFSKMVMKVSSNTSKLLFIAYSALNGLTLSSVFLVYKVGSIAMAFFAAAIMFGLLALYGFITKNDLTSFGKILLIGLLAVIITSIINMFIGNQSINIITSIISVLIFCGLTAYDMQKLKRLYNYYGEEKSDGIAIYGALDLYLDFINIFIHILSLFGGRRNN